MRMLVALFFLIPLFFSSTSALSQMLANPAMNSTPGHPLTSGGMVIQRVPYKYENDHDDIERKMLYADVGFALNAKFDIFGQLGYIFRSEFRDLSDMTGSGFMYGLGPRFEPYATKAMRVEGYGLLNMTSEEFKSGSDDGSLKLDQETTDIHLGGTVTYIPPGNARPYLGIDLVMNSDGKIKSKAGDSSYAGGDVKRDGLVSIRLGANFPFSGIGFRPEILLAGEQTITLSLWSAL